MRITASQIIEWVNTNSKIAQTDLPRLIRRLCFDIEQTRQLAFPAGDSTFVPGWDGVLTSLQSNTWVPAGTSYWEIGCDQSITSKANDDYGKRLTQTEKTQRLNTSFVFVTPRRWTQKQTWLETKRKQQEWADIRVYDADDLEQWLEQSPAIALQFAEELGLHGNGVESISRHWQSWSQQCQPTITPEAFFIDRIATRDKLLDHALKAVTSQQPTSPLIVRADSVEEATAFTIATLMGSPELANQTLVVTDTQGWRFVEANNQLKIAVAARTEVANTPTQKLGTLVIVPHVIGDWGSNQAEQYAHEIVLERPGIYEFEKTLVEIGVEPTDAKRFALNTGRSWTVFRRQRANNPAICNPHWLTLPQSESLLILCLLGSWLADNETDCRILAQLANKPYEEIEEDLRYLATIDDPPILSIGKVWKAKSPLELLALYGHFISRTQLDRFFLIAAEMLTASDPQLELPDEQRYAAQIYGKVHPFSGRLFQSICDALIKLAVRGAEQQSMQALDVVGQVSRFVEQTLNGADNTRWLSLASYLSTLAEAAPDAFLNAVETSLRSPNTSVAVLLTETSNTMVGGRCWHADLLWALELLAWSPRHFPRVVLILAKLSRVQTKNTWANTPIESLYGLFRSWWPQTTAHLNERIQVLDLLIKKDEDTAYNVLSRLTGKGQEMASSNHRPKWRDDDAGSNYATNGDAYAMFHAAKERIYRLSEGNASRLAALLSSMSIEDQEEVSKLLTLLQPFTQSEAKDQDKIKFQAILRKKIHAYFNYTDSPTSKIDTLMAEINQCYEQLAPVNLIQRHIWLFNDYWVDLPCKDTENHDNSAELSRLRVSALNEIYRSQQMQGIKTLIMNCTEPASVGNTLSEVQWSELSWDQWIANNGDEFLVQSPISQCISGLFWTNPNVKTLITSVMTLGRQCQWSTIKFARLLILAQAKNVYQIAADSGPEINQTYWALVKPNHYRGNNKEELVLVLTNLMTADRPLAALQYCQYKPEQVDAVMLFTIIQQALYSKEKNTKLIESYYLCEILAHLQQPDAIEKMPLIQLEFALLPALGFRQENKAKTLYEAVTTEPAIFTELLCLIYKAENADRTDNLDDNLKTAANTAWELFHDYSRLPGTQADGTIEHQAFNDFIRDARELCRQQDRVTMCDQTLGQIFAHSPTDEDGIWPCSVVRDLLDLDEMAALRRGFYTGTRNKRGVTTRSMLEGGTQERELATWYRNHAAKIQFSQLNVAKLLEDIAQSYEREAQREDEEASLSKEGF